MKKPAISIVTPSFNMLPYMKLCAASVHDQELMPEHIVMDGGSTDGTVEWLKQNALGISWVSEKDKGMYNALNKAVGKAGAEIIGHLNCDEQYLPGTLKRVVEYFNSHPEVDFVAGDFLVINPEGHLVAYRKTFHPRWPYFFSNYLYTTTCALFYRRRIFEKCSFDESYRSIADVIFLYHVMRAGFKGAHLKGYMSAFTYSGSNLSLDPVSAKEKKRFYATLPGWFKWVKPLFFVSFFVEKLLHGNYGEGSELQYSIYTHQSPMRRVQLTKTRPTFRLRFVPLKRP